MRIKSYFTPSVQEAMERARLELGPEAMLMSSKKTGPEAHRLGAYEVVFGVVNEAAAPVETNAQRSSPSSTSQHSDALVRELADLRKQIETVKRSVSRQSYQARWTGTQMSLELTELYEWLIGADFSEETALELTQAVAGRLPSENLDLSKAVLNGKRKVVPELLRNILREELEERFRTLPELGPRNAEYRVAAFVGPSGGGKTTTLVKLALKYGVASRTPIQILSTDTLRVGGAEQLGAYARIMGVGFQAVPTITALEQALEECRTKRLVLIDTPGYSSAEMDEAGELKTFFSRNPEIDVHLVVPATLRTSALSAVIERFAILRPSKLLFTHLDDAETPGAALDPAIRSRLPISYLAHGQQIPEDIEEASKTRLTDKLFERLRAAASYAA
jgi:flagellar biosynthesis protein FlhF